MWPLLLNIFNILQRPKVLVFLSVIMILFFSLFLNRSKQPVTLKAHVNFKGMEREVSFEKGDELKKLRYLAMVAFSDVGLDKVPPACVKLFKYKSVEHHVPLQLDLKLEDDIQVQVKLPSTQEEMVSCGLEVGHELYHRIEPNVPYRLWNQATGTLLLWLPEIPNSAISCNGSFEDTDHNRMVFTSMGAGKERFAFTFHANETSNTYVLNAIDDHDVEGSEYHHTLTTSMKFEPSYYWSFTLFRSMAYNTLYLGCSKDGRARLLPMSSINYPDPRTLFIANKYDFPDPYIP